MITIEEAEQILNSIPAHLKVEEAFLPEALNRILAKDIKSSIDMPPFDKSAMDGYAISSVDISQQYCVVEIIPAGIMPIRCLKNGECAKIMTGGVLPKGADRVVKKEVTSEEKGIMQIIEEDSNRNVCIRGEDVKVGDVILKKGVKIRASEIGVMASIGLAKINLYRKPVVGILSTGSELVKPGKSLPPGMIFDSNSYSLAAQVTEVGALANPAGIVTDNKECILTTIEGLLKSCDLVLLSGGVSMGDFDYVPSILKELGFLLHFESVAIKPGKPTVFASRDEKMIFGVPGNPVSTFVIFEVLIKPFLFRMMGHKHQPFILRGKMESRVSRKNAERSAFIPVNYSQGLIKTLSYHGSAHIDALSKANGLICFPRGIKEIQAGSDVNVRSIS